MPRIAVKDNFIRRVSLDFKQEEAISGFFTQAVEISHNDIQGVPYCGIALGWWWGNAGIPPSTVPKDNVIAANRIVDTQQDLHGDGGAIYVLGQQPGSRIEGNYIRSATRALYPDDGSAFWTIRRNVLDPRDQCNSCELRSEANRKPGLWLHIWTDRVHDLTIVDNYTTIPAALNRGINCQPTKTHIEPEFSFAAEAIIAAAGLEPPYRNIAEPHDDTPAQ